MTKPSLGYDNTKSQKINRLKLLFKNVENLFFSNRRQYDFFFKHAILKAKLRFCQTLNYAF
jgi:hypothetical protein